MNICSKLKAESSPWRSAIMLTIGYKLINPGLGQGSKQKRMRTKICSVLAFIFEPLPLSSLLSLAVIDMP